MVGAATTGAWTTSAAAPAAARGGRWSARVTAISAVPTVAAAAAISTAVFRDAGRPSAAPMPLPAATVSGGHSTAIGGT